MRNTLKRKLIQISFFGITNSHFMNFKKGAIYKGPWKGICTPGMNCYSCPAAGAACPIGALQAVAGSAEFDFSFYIVGMILAIGVVLGRFICAFLCPFGLFQELLYKIPFFRLNLWKGFHYIKYGLLLIFVLALPALLTNYMGIGKPTFCQYICPVGLLEGGIPLLITHPELRRTIGSLFGLKTIILVITILGCLTIYRFFCKVMCPLGAIYGLLNRISIYRLYIEEDKCTDCGYCKKICKMGVNPVNNPDSTECIRCGECMAACPNYAIKIGFKIQPHLLKKNSQDIIPISDKCIDINCDKCRKKV